MFVCVVPLSQPSSRDHVSGDPLWDVYVPGINETPSLLSPLNLSPVDIVVFRAQPDHKVTTSTLFL